MCREILHRTLVKEINIPNSILIEMKNIGAQNLMVLVCYTTFSMPFGSYMFKQLNFGECGREKDRSKSQ
jgi:hypothetical protein